MNGFSCDCVDGYEGDHCDVNHDDCLPNPCENGGSCQVSREHTVSLMKILHYYYYCIAFILIKVIN